MCVFYISYVYMVCAHTCMCACKCSCSSSLLLSHNIYVPDNFFSFPIFCCLLTMNLCILTLLVPFIYFKKIKSIIVKAFTHSVNQILLVLYPESHITSHPPITTDALMRIASRLTIIMMT